LPSGKHLVLEVAPGEHVLQVRIDTTGYPKLGFMGSAEHRLALGAEDASKLLVVPISRAPFLQRNDPEGWFLIQDTNAVSHTKVSELNRPRFDAASFLAEDAVMPKRYPSDQRERAVRMVLDRLGEYPSPWAAAQALGPKLGVGAETLRKWIVQAQVDGGARTGPTSEELAEIKRLRREVRDLKEANEILKAASIFFAGELDPRHR